MANIRDSLSHTKWLCKYHIVFTPKYRRKAIYGQYKKSIGQILLQLCNYKGVAIVEGHLMPDHVHMLVSIPPKYSVSQFMRYLKGKSSLMIFKYILKLCQMLYSGGHINTCKPKVKFFIETSLDKKCLSNTTAAIYRN